MMDLMSPTAATIFLVVLGLGIFGHTLRIAYVCPKKTPNIFVILVSACLASGVGLVYEAIFGEIYRAMEFGVGACALQLMTSLWLWNHGIRPHTTMEGDFLPTDISDFMTDQEIVDSARVTLNDSNIPSRWWESSNHHGHSSPASNATPTKPH